ALQPILSLAVSLGPLVAEDLIDMRQLGKRGAILETPLLDKDHPKVWEVQGLGDFSSRPFAAWVSRSTARSPGTWRCRCARQGTLTVTAPATLPSASVVSAAQKTYGAACTSSSGCPRRRHSCAGMRTSTARSTSPTRFSRWPSSSLADRRPSATT